MADVFISYSRVNEDVARAMAQGLQKVGLTVFLDILSIAPGAIWTAAILEEVKRSPVLLFLASKSAIASPNANQELGMAMASGTKVIPVVWEIPPEKLPPWVAQYHAVVLTGKSPKEVSEEVNKLVASLAEDKKTRQDSDSRQQLTAVALVGLVLLGLALGSE
jgi:hypothetical protein